MGQNNNIHHKMPNVGIGSYRFSNSDIGKLPNIAPIKKKSEVGREQRRGVFKKGKK